MGRNDLPPFVRGSLKSDTVLLVEDDLEIRFAMKEALESEGYKVVSYASGLEALKDTESMNRASIILTDLQLPSELMGAAVSAVFSNTEKSDLEFSIETEPASFLDRWESILNLFLEPKYADSFLGDMRERVELKIVPQYGIRYAKRWYCCQMARSFGAFVFGKVKWLLGLAFFEELLSKWLVK